MVLQGVYLAAIPKDTEYGHDMLEICACYKIPNKPYPFDEAIYKARAELPPEHLSRDDRFCYTELVLERLVKKFLIDLRTKNP